MYMKKVSLIFSMLLSTYMFAQQVAPQVVTTSGNVSQQSNATISYTIGEPVIQTATDGTTILTQGYQQPHYNVTLLPQYENILPNINVFPNPTADQLQISFDMDKRANVIVTLFDVAGKQIQEKKFDATPKSTFTLPMQQVATGKYMLRIMLPDLSSQKTFEIIKDK